MTITINVVPDKIKLKEKTLTKNIVESVNKNLTGRGFECKVFKNKDGAMTIRCMR